MRAQEGGQRLWPVTPTHTKNVAVGASAGTTRPSALFTITPVRTAWLLVRVGWFPTLIHALMLSVTPLDIVDMDVDEPVVNGYFCFDYFMRLMLSSCGAFSIVLAVSDCKPMSARWMFLIYFPISCTYALIGMIIFPLSLPYAGYAFKPPMSVISPIVAATLWQHMVLVLMWMFVTRVVIPHPDHPPVKLDVLKPSRRKSTATAITGVTDVWTSNIAAPTPPFSPVAANTRSYDEQMLLSQPAGTNISQQSTFGAIDVKDLPNQIPDATLDSLQSELDHLAAAELAEHVKEQQTKEIQEIDGVPGLEDIPGLEEAPPLEPVDSGVDIERIHRANAAYHDEVIMDTAVDEIPTTRRRRDVNSDRKKDMDGNDNGDVLAATPHNESVSSLSVAALSQHVSAGSTSISYRNDLLAKAVDPTTQAAKTQSAAAAVPDSPFLPCTPTSPRTQAEEMKSMWRSLFIVCYKIGFVQYSFFLMGFVFLIVFNMLEASAPLQSLALLIFALVGEIVFPDKLAWWVCSSIKDHRRMEQTLTSVVAFIEFFGELFLAFSFPNVSNTGVLVWAVALELFVFMFSVRVLFESYMRAEQQFTDAIANCFRCGRGGLSNDVELAQAVTSIVIPSGRTTIDGTSRSDGKPKQKQRKLSVRKVRLHARMFVLFFIFKSFAWFAFLIIYISMCFSRNSAFFPFEPSGGCTPWGFGIPVLTMGTSLVLHMIIFINVLRYVQREHGINAWQDGIETLYKQRSILTGQMLLAHGCIGIFWMEQYTLWDFFIALKG